MELLNAKRIDPVDGNGNIIIGAPKVWVVAFMMTEEEFEAIGAEAEAKGELDDEDDESNNSPIISV